MIEEQNSEPEERTETEVFVRPKHRQHTAEYKLRILRELENAPEKVKSERFCAARDCIHH